jgi:glycosyltransferase involved in cell wall biosynthesis
MEFKNGIHFISKPILGGAELIALNLAKETGSVVISIFRFKKLKLEEYEIHGLFFFLQNIFFIKKAFSHTSSTYLFNVLIAFFLRYENIFVLHCRLNLIKRYLKLLIIFSKEKKIICVSKSVFDEASKSFKNSQLHLIENIPLHKSTNNKNRYKKGGLRFFYIGRIAKEKRIYEFIRYLKTNNKNEEVEIIGSGENHTIKSINDIKYSSLILRGWLNNPYNSITRSDVIIIPSLSESFSLVLHEAISFGIRVYIFDKTLFKNISEEESKTVILVDSFEKIFSHLKANPPNNVIKESNTKGVNSIKYWASRYSEI